MEYENWLAQVWYYLGKIEANIDNIKQHLEAQDRFYKEQKEAQDRSNHETK